jgi:hypothetical protein
MGGSHPQALKLILIVLVLLLRLNPYRTTSKGITPTNICPVPYCVVRSHQSYPGSLTF